MQSDITSDLEWLNFSLGDLDRVVASLDGKAELLRTQNEENEKLLVRYTHNKEVCQKAIVLVGLAGSTARDSIKAGFENIVTHALESIVGAGYTFEIAFNKRGNVQEANFSVKSEEMTEAFDPMDSRGGGIIDIISLALRISLLELFYPKIEGPLILDEPFKHLSSAYIAGAGEFLNGIANKIGRQIIVVTHINSLTHEADNIIEVK